MRIDDNYNERTVESNVSSQSRYPYSDQFSVKEYDEVSSDVLHKSNLLMRRTLDELNLDVVVDSQTSDTTESGPSAFH